MMMGPAPMMRMVEISVRLGIGFLGPSLGADLTRPPSHEKSPLRDRNRPEGGASSRVLAWGGRARPFRGDLKPRSLAEIRAVRKGDGGHASTSCFRARKLSTLARFPCTQIHEDRVG